MGTTTFTGPIKSGPILNTSGDTLGKDIANVGYALMVQSVNIIQGDTDLAIYRTGITIPAHSRIFQISVNTTVPWTNFAAITICKDDAGTPLAGSTSGLDYGTIFLTADDISQSAFWKNIGPTDLGVWLFSNSAGVGEATLSITYIQDINSP